MEYLVRKMRAEEYPLLEDFLYEAIFKRKGEPPVPRTIVEKPELQVYIRGFGEERDDHCFCAEADGRVVGAVWVRNINGYGSVDEATPEFAVSLYEEYRGRGIGTELMRTMLGHLKQSGYAKASLAVQKDNYALKLYLTAGFRITGENEEEYIMVCSLNEERPALKPVGSRRMETERLILRPVTAADGDACFYGWQSRPECSRFFPWETARDRAEAQRRVEGWAARNQEGDFFQWGIEWRETGELVGMISLHHPDEDAGTIETSYVLNPDFWNRGIMTEAYRRVLMFAFGEIGLHKVAADVFEGNAASEAVLKKCGMKCEGTCRDKYFKDGRYCSAVQYGILSEEFHPEDI